MHPAAPQLADLDLLLSVDRLGSLGKAAREHGMSQPAASVRIQALERRLGQRLLERSPSGSHFTPAGTALAHWAREAIDAVSQLMSCSAALNDDGAGTLRLSACLTMAESVIPRWITELRGQSPDLFVSVQAGTRQAVLEDTRTGRVDLGFVAAGEDCPHLHQRVIAIDELVVVVATDHPWARLRVPLSPAELAAGRLVLRDHGFGSRASLGRELGGVWPGDRYLELPSTAAIKEAVEVGAGAAVLNRLAVRRQLAEGLLVRVPVSGPRVIRKLCAVWDMRTPLAAPARMLLELATREHREAQALRRELSPRGAVRPLPSAARAISVASAS